jgi:LmbE family N-acetylglucosaminyl deacetylase
MGKSLRLMAVLAHPDDESLALGGTLVSYAAQDIEVSIVMATRGEAGWQGDKRDDPGPEELGKLREAELRAAVKYLGASELVFLDYIDGKVGEIDPEEATARIAREIRRIRPQVVVTFGPDGAYGHPDHIAISQFTTAAVIRAADPCAIVPGYPEPHDVAKLYYRIWTEEELQAYVEVFGETTIDVDSIRRSFFAWPEWAVSAKVSTVGFWANISSAVRQHRSQIGDVAVIDRLSKAGQERLWSAQHFYRAFSTVGPAGVTESDLFGGLRGV